jgi:hypothetical protein
MKIYIQAQGFEIWQSIVDGYTSPIVPPKKDKAVKLGQNNSKAKHALLNGLSETIFTKVSHCNGDPKFKIAKIQNYRGQFEQLNMKEYENIATYILRVDETINEIIGLGEEIKESEIVQKVLRSLPMRFDSKISSLE